MDNNLTWTNIPGVTNRDFVARAWYDEDNDQELDETESRRSVNIKVLETFEVEQLAFVPLNTNITLAITIEPAIDYTLILSANNVAGASGWATFEDGSTNRPAHGSTNIVIHGATLSSVLKDMRLTAITAGGELFHRDFTVGQIQIRVSDEWNGIKIIDIPLTNADNVVAAVSPGDYVYLLASCVPSSLSQSLGWQVGTNAPVSGVYLTLTREDAGEEEVNLTIDDPQDMMLSIIMCNFE